ncbi:MAG: hypothetical protein JO020_15145 [Chloroflexi bacterium]|nr:hypothetical protein [Chloroflexota bacterium]MBV9895498.1 hypothetical protein [Chloroflexota bacterium]
MSGRFWLGLLVTLWAGLVGPAIGFAVGQRYSGLDCQLSPTLGSDILATLARAFRILRSLPLPSAPGGARMLSDPSMWLAPLLVAALAGAAWWLWRGRAKPTQPEPETLPEPTPVTPISTLRPRRGAECKLAIGSAGIKCVVREGRMEDAYQIRLPSETAFEAFADFDKHQERVAIANRVNGPSYLVLSDTLDAHTSLSEGLGNRPPAEVWDIREEWMPGVSHFIDEAALCLRSAGVWPARITADLSAGGHGVPGLFALARMADEFPRADRHAHFIVPEGDVERTEAVRLLDALRSGGLLVGQRLLPMPWQDKLPLALTTLIRDNRRGRDDLDEVAAHIAPALSARVRYETGTSENLSNLMRRLTKHGPHSESEPCPLTFEYAYSAVPITAGGAFGRIDVSSLSPIADATLRALRFGEGVKTALEAEIGRHLVLVTMPCNDWEDVRQVEQYVLERLEFAGMADRRRVGIFFSGYRADPNNRQERALAIRLGTVEGGWDAVYRAIVNAPHTVYSVGADRVDGVPRVSESAP